jgi:Mn-dependent DtxR family transcriptional regulator
MLKIQKKRSNIHEVKKNSHYSNKTVSEYLDYLKKLGIIRIDKENSISLTKTGDKIYENIIKNF